MNLARRDGFEPPFTAPKTVVLPLDDPRNVTEWARTIDLSLIERLLSQLSYSDIKGGAT